jgi:hypothetical protein
MSVFDCLDSETQVEMAKIMIFIVRLDSESESIYRTQGSKSAAVTGRHCQWQWQPVPATRGRDCQWQCPAGRSESIISATGSDSS